MSNPCKEWLTSYICEDLGRIKEEAAKEIGLRAFDDEMRGRTVLSVTAALEDLLQYSSRTAYFTVITYRCGGKITMVVI